MTPFDRFIDWFCYRSRTTLIIGALWPLLVAAAYAAFIYVVTV